MGELQWSCGEEVRPGETYYQHVDQCLKERRPHYRTRLPQKPAAMTPHAPLTDEELAQFEESWRQDAKPPPVLRLIADLRAARAEVERLRTFLDDTDRKRYESEALADWWVQQ